MTALITLIAQTYPTTAPANETPWERVALALIAAGVVVALAWLKRVTSRQDVQGERIHTLALESVPVEPQVLRSQPIAPPVFGTGPGAVPGSRVPGRIDTRPTHSTEPTTPTQEPPCDAT